MSRHVVSPEITECGKSFEMNVVSLTYGRAAALSFYKFRKLSESFLSASTMVFGNIKDDGEG